MALSRVRSLSTLRSVGLTSDIRELIDLGPPDGFLTRFLKVFGEKILSTQQGKGKEKGKHKRKRKKQERGERNKRKGERN